MARESETATPQGATIERVSLREELGAMPMPSFELALPTGWGRIATDEGGQADLERRVSERMMRTGRPDLMAGLRAVLRESMTSMRDHGAVAVFLPLDPDGAGQTGTPTSITAFLRTGTPEAPLDEYVQQAIRRFEAQPFFDDLRTLRFETESSRDLDGVTAIISTTHYITPVPGTRRQRALELLATYGRPESMPRDDERVELLHAMFDLCASTLRWTREGA
ncbi:hypothetical protein [Agrococcus sp. ProA11]|uniref:hypothetical protein n=1 Tax=Agrococcus chionoecetis TaxID=3153752 RepID=UPI003261C8CD